MQLRMSREISLFIHRMDMTMLSDLNRDNLAFLGITILGDVIKVTKHAKIVAEKLNTDRILNDSPEVCFHNLKRRRTTFLYLFANIFF